MSDDVEREHNLVRSRVLLAHPYLLAGATCAGLACADAARVHGGRMAPAAAAGAVFAGAFLDDARVRVAVLAAGLALAGWWWGSARLDAIDSSILLPHVGEIDRATAVVTGPARSNGFELRVPARIVRFGSVQLGEPVLLELPVGRSPPQGAIIELDARLQRPRPPSHGFDERTWLRRHGIHVVVVARHWRIVGHRDGVGGYADRVRAWLAGSLAPGLRGERRAVLEGVVLGEDEGLSPDLRDAFRASGLYHLLS